MRWRNFTQRRWVIATRLIASAMAVLLSFLTFADAYQTPLDTKALHDAYVLGQRNDQSTGDFFAPYIKQMTESRSDLHVAEIEVLTPFAQVVDDSRKNSSGYTEQQAAQKYQQVGNTVLVNVTLMLPSVYPQASNDNGKDIVGEVTGKDAGTETKTGSSVPAASTPGGDSAKPDTRKPPTEAQAKSDLRPENFWQSFQFYFKQNGKNIASKALHDKPIYSTATKGTPAVLDGAAVWMEFDAKDVASQETVIEVVTPGGKTISVTFDLKKLR
jgi:hypothetical protein